MRRRTILLICVFCFGKKNKWQLSHWVCVCLLCLCWRRYWKACFIICDSSCKCRSLFVNSYFRAFNIFITITNPIPGAATCVRQLRDSYVDRHAGRCAGSSMHNRRYSSFIGVFDVTRETRESREKWLFLILSPHVSRLVANSPTSVVITPVVQAPWSMRWWNQIHYYTPTPLICERAVHSDRQHTSWNKLCRPKLSNSAGEKKNLS